MERYLRYIRYLFSLRVVRVASVGVAGLVVQTSIFEIVGVYLQLLRPSSAVIVAAELAVITTFLLNNRFSFGDHVLHAAPPLWRFLRFHLVVLGSIFLQWLCIFLVERQTDSWLYIHIAYGVGIVLGFIWNYNGYRLWVWKKHTADTPTPQ